MVRKATINDIEAIYSLLIEGASGGKVLKRSLRELESIVNDFFVYEKNNTVVGCCSLEIYSKKIAEIRSLVVAAKYRNLGIGSSLVKRCLIEAKKKKIYQVLSITDKNEFFRRYGFSAEVNEKQVLFLHIKGDTSL